MTHDLFALTHYRIRRKVLKLFGASFHVYDDAGEVVAFSSQKAFKLKEDIRVYADESRATQLLHIDARQIIDFSAAYDFVDSQADHKVGAARRKGWSSLLRDSWEILDADDHLIANIQEDSTGLALLRRFLTNLVPQRFHLQTPDGTHVADFTQRFNPFVYHLEVDIHEPKAVDPRAIFGAAVLLAAIEGRQG